MCCTAASHAALKSDPRDFRAQTVPVDGLLFDRVCDDCGVDVRLDIYRGANCRRCNSTLYVLFATVGEVEVAS